MKKQSQCQKILSHLKQGHAIHKLSAFKLFGCMTLAQRIKDLKKRGVEIATDYISVNDSHNVAVYYLPHLKAE